MLNKDGIIFRGLDSWGRWIDCTRPKRNDRLKKKYIYKKRERKKKSGNTRVENIDIYVTGNP